MSTAALPTQTGATDPGGYSFTHALGLLLLMVLITLGQDLAKLPLNVLVDPVRKSFGITDVQVSLLLGVWLAAPFVVGSLGGGWLSDRVSRRALLLSAMAVWTTGAILCALAPTFELLVAGRVLLGLGSGVKLPVAMTWVNDAFRPEQRGRAIGGFFVVLGAGPSLAIMLAGATQRWAESGVFAGWPWIAALEPWRATCLLLTVPTLLTMPFVLGLRDARRAAPAAAPSTTPAAAAGTGTAAMPVMLFVALVLSVALVVVIDGANLAWMPTVFTRNFGYDAQRAGFLFGVITLIAGAAGPLIGGWVGDAVFRRFGAAGRVWLCAAAVSACAPLLAVYLMREPVGLVLALTVSGIFTVTALSLGYVTLQALLPPHRRGLGTGITSATTNLIGSAGPTLVAWTSQHWLGGSMALPQGIVLVGGTAALLAALLFAFTARAFGRSR
jgi:MFS family permease